ncbi:MAG: SDR family oxidoreductase [Deltaproteobacteria bacterium]|nr:SDR family oxidoreductase [Deltaproteobacteria bacterium]
MTRAEHLVDSTRPTAVVTGASGGVGEAVCRRLAVEGWRVVGHARTQPVTRPDEPVTSWVTADFSQASAGTRFASQVKASLGEARLGLVVCCAGMGPVSGEEAEAEELWRANVLAPYRIVEGLLGVMDNPSTVVLVSSIAAWRASPGSELYGATKAAVESLTAGMAYRLGPAGVRVVAVAPGLVRTRMSAALWADPSLIERFRRQNPLGRMAEPSDVADAIWALASPDCRWVTGQVLAVDGGSFLGFGDEVWSRDGRAGRGFARG